MSVISYKCPSCGGDLQFDPKTQSYKCEFCMSTFEQSDLDIQDAQTDNKTETDEQQMDQRADGALVYSCPSCGAEIVTDATTAATFCYYCHNPVVLQGNLSGEYKPDLVIPFAVDKKEAVDSFLAYVRKKRFVPRDFFSKEQIEKITGVYFPFWIYDCKAEGEWRGEAKRIHVHRRGQMEITETDVYAVEREGELQFKNLTRDALDKENKQLVEAVQPFALEEAKEFHMGYLSGFQAEKRNLEKSQLLSGLEEEVRRHGTDMLKSSVTGYNTVSAQYEHVQIREDRWKYLLLPVWVLTYKGTDQKTYYYAMNGQTRKVSGIYPVAKSRILRMFLMIFVPVLLFMLAGGYFLW